MKQIVLALFVSLVIQPFVLAEDPASTPDHVRKSMQYLLGKWTADVELNGQKRKVEMTVKPTLDLAGYVIDWRGPGGPGNPDTRLKGIGGWDAASERYIESGIASNGDSFSFRYKQLSETSFEGEGSGTYMGKPMTEKVAVDRKSPDSFTWSATEIVVGGEAMPDEVYHYQRAPDVARAWMEYFPGKWSRETKIWTESQGWKSHTEEWSGELAAGGTANLYKGKTSEGVESAAMGSIYGDVIIEQGAASDGASWKITWNKVEANLLAGRLIGFAPGGVPGDGKITLERNDSGYVAKWELRLEDDSLIKGIETNTRR